MSKTTTIVSLRPFEIDKARYPNLSLFSFDNCPKDGDHLVVEIAGAEMADLERINIAGFRGTKVAVCAGDVRIMMSQLRQFGFDQIERSYDFNCSNH